MATTDLTLPDLSASSPAAPLRESAGFTGLLPATVACHEQHGFALGMVLTPAEAAGLSAQAVPRRRAEYATGRWCARTALGALGHSGIELPPGADGAPRWPAGITGSITHTRGLVAAAATWSGTALGIDAEPNRALPDGVLTAIADPDEQAMVHRLEAMHADVHWATVLFSVKESVFKAVSTGLGIRLRFCDVAVYLTDTGEADLVPTAAPGPARQLLTRLQLRFSAGEHIRTAAIGPRS